MKDSDLTPPPLWDATHRMLVKTIECSIHAHGSCPGGNATMKCICECHMEEV